jgi:hypothetical protein
MAAATRRSTGVSGHVTIRITCVGGINAVLSGLFFGSTGARD